MKSDCLSMFLSFIIWKTNNSDSNNDVPLCGYCYSSVVDLPVLIELEPLLKLYSYRYRPWCELYLEESTSAWTTQNGC